MEITTIGLDLAKSVFQLRAFNAYGAVVWRKKLRRSALLQELAKVPPGSVKGIAPLAMEPREG